MKRDNDEQRIALEIARVAALYHDGLSEHAKQQIRDELRRLHEEQRKARRGLLLACIVASAHDN